MGWTVAVPPERGTARDRLALWNAVRARGYGMKQELQSLVDEAKHAIAAAQSEDAVEDIRVLYLGKKGKLSSLLKGVAKLPADEKPVFGKVVNEAKDLLEKLLDETLARA